MNAMTPVENAARPEASPRGQAVRRQIAPRARYRFVLLSLWQWLGVFLKLRVLGAYDALRGQDTLENNAARLSKAIEGMGDTGVKVGQQVAMRIDLMPLEYSLALLSMDDRRPPMDFKNATRRIEISIGRPLAEVFSAVDPKPLSSTATFCSYKATLRANGATVVIKVRRSGVRNRLAADLVAVGWVLRVLEWATFFRPGFFASMQQELSDLANDRLDLYKQARLQTVFSKLAKSHGPRWVSAPEVHPELSNHAVMVRDYPDGIPLSQVIAAVDNRDAKAMASLRAMHIDPRVVGRRLLHAAWWAAFENLFFISGASAKKIVVQPGNHLVFIDFEESGALATNQKRLLQEMLVRLDKDDVAGSARSLIQALSPLPFIDVFDFTKRIEAGLLQELLALRDDQAQWWERTTIGIWRGVTRAARQNGVTLRLDLLRFMASMLAYDTLAAHLVPNLKFLRQFARYRRAATARAARQVRREVEAMDPEDQQAILVARMGRVSEGLNRFGTWVESTIENLPVSYLALSGKAAYAIARFVRLAGICLVILGLGVAARAFHTAAWGGTVDVMAHLSEVAFSGWYAISVSLLLAFTIRGVLFRLDDKGE